MFKMYATVSNLHFKAEMMCVLTVLYDMYIFHFQGEVIPDKAIKCVMGEGMPVYRDPFEKGRLIIQFTVKFPERIDISKIPQLESCLPPREEEIIPDDLEHVTMMTYDPQADASSSRGAYRSEAYDSDDEQPGGQRVQCASH